MGEDSLPYSSNCHGIEDGGYGPRAINDVRMDYKDTETSGLAENCTSSKRSNRGRNNERAFEDRLWVDNHFSLQS